MAEILGKFYRAYKARQEMSKNNCSTAASEQRTHSLSKKPTVLNKDMQFSFKEFGKMCEEIEKYLVISTTNGQDIISYKKRDRNGLNPQQVNALETEFRINPFPNEYRMEWLAFYLGLEKSRVTYWFQSRHLQEKFLLNYATELQTLTFPKCHVPKAVCDKPRSSERPVLKSKKEILVELLELDEVFSEEIIEGTNDLSFDQNIELSFLEPQVVAANDVAIDVDLLIPTLELTHISPKSSALENLENEGSPNSRSRRC